jgi:RNA polymerase sigma-70 factor (ECF subfamily)
MADEPEFRTTELHLLLDRVNAGERKARDELLNRVMLRLELLARKMLKQFPAVRRWEETGDILQDALLRLLRGLETKRPESTRDFFNLAANRIRSALLDLARKHGGPQGLGKNVVRPVGGGGSDPPPGPTPDPADVTPSTDELERWCAFHQAVEKLPAEEREVVGLHFYHGWSFVDIAELFQIDERSARRRWQRACVRLHELLGGDVPAP